MIRRRRRAVDGQLGVAQRVVGVGDRGDRPPDPDHHVRQRVARERGATSSLAALDEHGERVRALVGEVRDAAPARAAATSSRRTPDAGRARERITTSRAGSREVEPERRRARGQRQQVARLGGLERLLQQRRLDGLLLVAHDVAEPRHRGEQRRGRLRGRLGELGDEAAARARQHEPARRLVGARDDRRRDRVPAARPRARAGRAAAAQTSRQQLVDRRACRRRSRARPSASSSSTLASRKLRQPVDHRALGLRRAQRVDEVALERREAAEDLLLAAGERAVDEVDDLPERRLVRDGEHREAALARDLDERRRHALEAEPDAEPERARPALLELRHERPLRLGVAAQPHAGREHDPVAAEPARRGVDLDGVGAADLAGRGVRSRR